MASAAVSESSSAMIDQLAQFRRIANLADGTRVLLRPLQPTDRAGLSALLTAVSQEDLRFLRQDVTDPAVIDEWFEDYDLRRVFPLVALVNDRIVGDATLHMGEGPQRHLAWLRIYVAPEFRRRGVARMLVEGLVDVARKMGLHQVLAEVIRTRVKVIKLFEALGFSRELRYPDYFMAPDGEVFDTDVLILRLVRAVEYY